MAKKIGRREFVKKSAKIGFSAAVGSSAIYQLVDGSICAFGEEKIDIAVVSGSDYLNSTTRAVELLGGIKKFVPENSKVAILPNTQSRHPGTYTKPEIVRAVIKMCKEAGAKEINCLSWLTKKHWEGTGLAQAVEEEGAILKLIDMDDESLYKPVQVSDGKALKEAQVMKELYNNDVFINMPVTKDHAGNKFTGTMKNLMGLNFRKNNRTFHKEGWKTERSAIEHLDQCIVDLNTVIKPNLNIVDATEFITTNGPFGPGKLIKPQKIIAGTDRVAIDAYCTTLWGLNARDIIMINRGYEQKLGEINLKKVKIKEIKV
ncbi:MAG: DUF362 domain-containing protein [Candidatus Aminicenantes bacterium]|nr:DUF362 domain-containing protein [Candidatus Aminicenantes bacterium]MBL7083905.1 DUF362 domain-containing protein [Candidatus Aminicenantes bacterium]